MLELYKRAINKIRLEGFEKTVVDGVSMAYDHYYDYKYKLDTYSWVSIEELIIEDDVAKDASCYQATKVIPLRILFKKLKIPKDKVLVDIGSGKGRVLFIASEFLFKEVRGVELSKSLCCIAEKNIKTYKSKVRTNTNFEIVNMDASQYRFRDDEYMFFMYNPFNSAILNKVLQNIFDSLVRNPRSIKIVYAYPINRKYIEKFFQITYKQDYTIWNGEFTVYTI